MDPACSYTRGVCQPMAFQSPPALVLGVYFLHVEGQPNGLLKGPAAYWTDLEVVHVVAFLVLPTPEVEPGALGSKPYILGIGPRGTFFVPTVVCLVVLEFSSTLLDLVHGLG